MVEPCAYLTFSFEIVDCYFKISVVTSFTYYFIFVPVGRHLLFSKHRSGSCKCIFPPVSSMDFAKLMQKFKEHSTQISTLNKVNNKIFPIDR